MNSRSMANQSLGPRFMITAAAFVIIIAGMRSASPILIPFLLSVFLAIISAPPLFWLKKKGVPTLPAMLIVISSVLGIVFVLVFMIGTSLDDFSRSAPFYQQSLKEKTQSVLSMLDRMGVSVSGHGLLEAFDPGIVMKMVTRILSGLRIVLTNGFLILLTVIFILLEASSFPTKLRAVLGEHNHESFAHFDTFMSNMQRYIAIKTLTSLGTGITVAVWLTFLGIDYPLLWGLLAFLLNYVPNIGSILAAIPAVFLALIQLGTGSAILTILGYAVVNILFGTVIEPRVMGRGLGLSTLVVFLSLVFWGWVLGPVGMLLSVPLTMTLKIALDSSEDTRWIAILLGSGEGAKTLKASSPKENGEPLSEKEHQDDFS